MSFFSNVHPYDKVAIVLVVAVGIGATIATVNYQVLETRRYELCIARHTHKECKEP